MKTPPSYIHFSDEQYEHLRKTYRKWWSGELERPIVPVITVGHSSAREPSPYSQLAFHNAWDFSIAPEHFVDAYDWYLSTLRWHGDAFPIFPTTFFGPGTMAAFLGCTPIGSRHTVWFQPPRPDIPIEELHFEYNENNPYFRRVLNLFEAAMEKWHGQVIAGMIDMGGILDVLSSFRGAENLLMDLYDAPDEVHRCIHELQELWFLYYDKINAILAPETRGYTQWFYLYGEKPGYILQSDFSYMISPDMFREFVAPELTSSAARMVNAVYHLDGVGELPHLDQILAIDGIKGIQWYPGAGAPLTKNWDELVERILASGKKMLSWNQYPDGSPISIAKNLGQLYFDERAYGLDNLRTAREYLERYGIEWNEK